MRGRESWFILCTVGLVDTVRLILTSRTLGMFTKLDFNCTVARSQLSWRTFIVVENAGPHTTLSMHR